MRTSYRLAGVPGVGTFDVRGRLAAGLLFGFAALWVASPFVNRDTAALPGTVTQAPAPLQAGLREAASAAVGSGEASYRVRRDGAGFAAASGLLSSRFTRSAVSIGLGGPGVSFRAAGLPAAAPVASGNRVTYRRGDVTEWYTNGPLGLEQGFTLAKPRAAIA